MSAPDCASLVDKYTARAKETAEKLSTLLKDPTWKESKKEEEITFYVRSDPSSSFNQVKSVVSIPASLEEVAKEVLTINEINEQTPKDKKHGFDFSKVLYRVENDPDERVFFYIALTSPGMMVSGRDFILFRMRVKVGEQTFFVSVNVDEDELHPPTKTYVRGNMLFQGYAAEEVDGNIQLTFYAHADPKGSIPAWAYNTVATNQGYAAKGIKKAVLEAKK